MADTEEKNTEVKEDAPKKVIDPKDTNLRDKAAVKFWQKHFGEQEIVSNDEFTPKLEEYIKKKKIVEDDSQRNDFVSTIVKRFLCVVDPGKYPDKTPSSDYIDKHGVQYAINVFGPWIQMFNEIHKHFFDNEFDFRPVDVFHGIISDEASKALLVKGNENKSAKKRRFLIRYGWSVLIISSIRRGKRKTIRYYDEPLVRKKPYTKKTGSKKKVPPRWSYSEKIAAAGGFRTNTTIFTTLSNALQYLQGEYCKDLKNVSRRRPKITTPIRAPGFEIDESKEDSPEPESEPEPEPLKCVDDDEDETDEERMKQLELEENKENQVS